MSVNPIQDNDGEIDTAQNIGLGSSRPGGQTCLYNGKVVDCLAYANDSGGISSEFLIEMMTYFDKIDLFPQVSG